MVFGECLSLMDSNLVENISIEREGIVLCLINWVKFTLVSSNCNNIRDDEFKGVATVLLLHISACS